MNPLENLVKQFIEAMGRSVTEGRLGLQKGYLPGSVSISLLGVPQAPSCANNQCLWVCQVRWAKELC